MIKRQETALLPVRTLIGLWEVSTGPLRMFGVCACVCQGFDFLAASLSLSLLKTEVSPWLRLLLVTGRQLLSPPFSLSVSPSSVVRMKETQGKSSLCLPPPPTATPPTIPIPQPPAVSKPLPHPHISVFHPMMLAVRQIDTPSPIVSTLSCKFVTSSSFWGDGGGDS